MKRYLVIFLGLCMVGLIWNNIAPANVNLPYNLINMLLKEPHTWTGTQTFKAITIDSTYFDVDVGGLTTYGTSGNSTFSVDGAGNVMNAGSILSIGSGADWTEPNLGSGTRFLWYPKKAALRAGSVNSTQWDDANIGYGSFAAGVNTTAAGAYSTAFGYGSSTSNEETFVSGNYSVASGAYSSALGNQATASGTASVSLGSCITAGSAAQTIALGAGVDASNKLVNNIANSLMVGFNSTIPTLFVGPSTGIGTTGSVGVATSSPNANVKLDVNGIGGFQSGVSVGATSPISGLTSFVCIDSGVSPVGSMTRGAIFYSVNNEMWVNDGNGTHTQISPHDPETGELYVNSYNVYTGKGEKYYPKTGKIVEYTVEKISPEIVAKTEFVKAYVADANNATWVPIPEEEAIDEDKKLKGGCRKNELTGLFEKRIMATPEKAEAKFNFNWERMPKFVRNAWGK